LSALPILRIRKGDEVVQEVSVKEDLLIGRDRACVIRLEDRAISRKHALLRNTKSGIAVEKQSPFGKLQWNGQECTRAILNLGDVIELGPYLLELRDPETSEGLALGTSQPEQKRELPTPDETPPPAHVESTDPQAPMAIALVEPEVDLMNFSEPENPKDSTLKSEPEDLTKPVEFEMEVPMESPPSVAVSDATGSKTVVLSQESVSVELHFSPGEAQQEVYRIPSHQETVRFGRAPECEVILKGGKVSRHHATLRREGMHFFLRDEGSANGTYVNGDKIQEIELSGDDDVRIGEIHFRFKVVQGDDRIAQIPSVEVTQVGEEELPLEYPTRIDLQMGASVSPALSEFQNPQSTFGINPPVTPPDSLLAPGSEKRGIFLLIHKYLVNFKDLRPLQKLLVVLSVFLFVSWYFDLDEMVAPPKPKPKTSQTKKKNLQGSSTLGVKSFDELSTADQKLVETQYELGVSYFRNRQYDESIDALGKILKLIPEYKDSTEVLRYAEEGKRRLEAQKAELEKKRNEEELRRRIGEMVAQAEKLMSTKKYEEAKPLFNEILALDPENSKVANWRRQIENEEEELRLQEQSKRVDSEISARAYEKLEEGMKLFRLGKYQSSIEVFSQVSEIGAVDPKPAQRAKAMIAAAYGKIRGLRDPLLASAKKAEEEQRLSEAFKLYQKATRVDPSHPVGFAGMERIRGVLTERAKGLYTEAVLAESYSDFTSAEQKYREILKTTPSDNLYYERATRKLKTYLRSVSSEPRVFTPSEGVE
jgi:pSer/pThr/pTyr-binding forkhead associated (FHA) protein/tetratricopeptide (TPR) repeat protein